MKKRVHRGGSFLCTDQYCSRYMVGTRGKGEGRYRHQPPRLPLRQCSRRRAPLTYFFTSSARLFSRTGSLE